MTPEAKACQNQALLAQKGSLFLPRANTVRRSPQDPSDEPASVLLARIRAERAALAATSTQRGRRAKERE